MRDTKVFLPLFSFPLPFRYRLLSKDNKLLYFFKIYQVLLETSTMKDWVAQGGTTQHNLVAHRNFGCPQQPNNR